MISRERLQQALAKTMTYLLKQRKPEGYWEGRLSSSALSTATAVSALSLASEPDDQPLIENGLHWLAETQNTDGGWGDTADSPSNLATTLLTLSALRLAPAAGHEEAATRAQRYVAERTGSTPAERATAISRVYGEDRTFAVPILLNCALAGFIEWRDIPSLPYELAVLPQSWYRRLRLQVVSYALPALIAVGQAVEYHRALGRQHPLRRLSTSTVRRQLRTLQPQSGGFLEATPLTAFVCMSLLSLGHCDEPVVQQGLQFLRASMRQDGSWPIDTNLTTWVTTNALNALTVSGTLPEDEINRTRDWLMERQYVQRHPYTGADPGGWSWTYLSGGVPDADDTSGALLALAQAQQQFTPVLRRGGQWLLDLQNADGGWPTFCRGWGKLPFDMSCDDITAHALRALHATLVFDHVTASSLEVRYIRQARQAIRRAMNYLRRRQRVDGAWVPLWFGNQYATDHLNPVFGTARVLLALAELEPDGDLALRGLDYLAQAQNDDGGWGGEHGVASSVEETALAISALTGWRGQQQECLEHGLEYLLYRVDEDTWVQTTPLGLYFASLWYAEDLYPVVWTVEALGRALRTSD